MTTAYSTDMRAPLGSYQDRIFDATTMPNTTTLTSSAFRFGKTQAGGEVVIKANTQITILDTKAVTIELLWDTTSGGSFSNSRVIAAYAASGANIVFAAGAVMGRIVPETDVEHFCKIKITATADQSAGKVDANIYRIA